MVDDEAPVTSDLYECLLKDDTADQNKYTTDRKRQQQIFGQYIFTTYRSGISSINPNFILL